MHPIIVPQLEIRFYEKSQTQIQKSDFPKIVTYQMIMSAKWMFKFYVASLMESNIDILKFQSQNIFCWVIFQLV